MKSTRNRRAYIKGFMDLNDAKELCQDPWHVAGFFINFGMNLLIIYSSLNINKEVDD